MTPDPHVLEEIRRQPHSWRRALSLVPDVIDVLPRAGARIAVIGCGTSWFMAEAYASLREGAGLGETDAFAASEFPAGRSYDAVVAISRSGTTTEVGRALDATRAPSVLLTALPHAPIGSARTQTVLLDFADEQSVVQTDFATTSLMLLRASLGQHLDGVIDQAESVLAGGWPVVEEVSHAAQITFLGHGWAAALAREAALKMRESAQQWTEAYPQMEYRHGPIAIAEPGRVSWILGEAVPGLLDDLAPTGVTVVDDDLDPIVDLVRAQLVAVHRAQALGLDPDRPRHLTRSVVLAAR